MPARMPADAICTALRPGRAVAVVGEPGTEVSPRRTAMLRAITPPPWSDSATTMSSMSVVAIPERSTAAPTAISASWNASTSTSDPLRARPIGVRAAATMTASVTVVLLGSRVRERCYVPDRTDRPRSRRIQDQAHEMLFPRPRQVVETGPGPGPGASDGARAPSTHRCQPMASLSAEGYTLETTVSGVRDLPPRRPRPALRPRDSRPTRRRAPGGAAGTQHP